MKKGFTLIELITVVALLAIISAIIIPTVLNNVRLSKDSAKSSIIDNIEKAAKRYGIENNLGYSSNKRVLTFEQLINGGYLEDKRIIDPTTDEELIGCILYHWDDTKSQYIYEYSEVCESENYNVGDYVKVQLASGITKNFYVLSVNGSNLTLILDRNLGDNIAWGNSGDTTPTIASTQLPTTWRNASKVRLPYTREIISQTEWYKSLTNKSNWESEYISQLTSVMSDQSIMSAMYSCTTNKCFRDIVKSFGYENFLLPEWLDVNLFTSGDSTQDSNNYYKNGYWPAELITNSNTEVWGVGFIGIMTNVGITNSVELGVRPVIEIDSQYIIEGLSKPEYVDSGFTRE